MYLWAKSWEKEGESSSTQQTCVSQTQVVAENEFKPQLENAASCSHNEEKPASGTNIVAELKVTEQKDVMSVIENVETGKPNPKTEDREAKERQIQEETAVVKMEASQIVSSADAVEDKNRLDSKTSEESSETEIGAVTAENIGGNDIIFPSGTHSSLSNKHPSSTTDKTNLETITLSPNENAETKTYELQLQIDKADLPQAVEDVHEYNQEANPTVKQVEAKEETCNTVAENLEQPEEKESSAREVSPETKLKGTDVCNPSEVISEQPDLNPAEGTVKPNSEEKPTETTSQLESHGLLHQALTNGSQAANSPNNGAIGSQLETSGHPMLQLPICQSELMQFASTMADNLRATGKFANLQRLTSVSSEVMLCR